MDLILHILGHKKVNIIAISTTKKYKLIEIRNVLLIVNTRVLFTTKVGTWIEPQTSQDKVGILTI